MTSIPTLVRDPAGRAVPAPCPAPPGALPSTSARLPRARPSTPTMTDTLVLRSLIRTVPDFPKPGVRFRDITTLLKDARGFRAVVERLAEPYAGRGVDKVAGIESRGFIVGA